MKHVCFRRNFDLLTPAEKWTAFMAYVALYVGEAGYEALPVDLEDFVFYAIGECEMRGRDYFARKEDPS